MNQSYFENRIDRYILFKNSATLSEYLIDLTDNLYQIYEEYGGNEISNINRNSKFIYSPRKLTNFDLEDPNYVYIYPCLQMGKHGIDQDMKVSKVIFSNLPSIMENSSTSIICTSYLNLTSWFRNALLKARGDWKILTSSPEANSFYNSKGFSSYVPKLYQYNLHSLFRDAKERSNNIQAYEFTGKDKTFHAKGRFKFLINYSSLYFLRNSDKNQ